MPITVRWGVLVLGLGVSACGGLVSGLDQGDGGGELALAAPHVEAPLETACAKPWDCKAPLAAAGVERIAQCAPSGCTFVCNGREDPVCGALGGACLRLCELVVDGGTSPTPENCLGSDDGRILCLAR